MTTDAREISQAELDSLFAIRDSLDAENKALREFASGIWGKQATAALILRVPESGDPDLDAMIRTAQRRDLAAQVLNGFMSQECPTQMERDAQVSCMFADALLSALSHPVAEKEGDHA